MAEPKQPPASSTGAGDSTKRKPWIKKDAVESMLDLIKKQEKRVATLQKEVEKETKQLAKLQAAKKVLEAS